MNIKNIIFIAPPAAGKGTQAAMLSSKYNIPHVSIGEVLRQAAKEDTERGRMIADNQAKGILVSNEITIELLKERLQQDDCSNGYILDGFPRSIEQALLYENLLSELEQKLECVIYLDVDKKVAINRTIGRLSCPKCGNMYNSLIEGLEPKNENLCDHCNVELIKRTDDNIETFEVRFNTYVEKTKPLIEYYENKGVLYRVDGGLDKENTFEQIEKIIRGEI